MEAENFFLVCKFRQRYLQDLFIRIQVVDRNEHARKTSKFFVASELAFWPALLILVLLRIFLLLLNLGFLGPQ